MTLSSDYSWHEVSTSGGTVGGTPLTADHVAQQLRIDGAFGADYWDVVSSVTVTNSPSSGGGGSLRVTFDGAVNRDVAAFDVLTTRLSHAPEYFDSGVGQAPYESLRIEPGSAGPPVGSGPFRFVEVTADRLRLEPAPGHPASGSLSFEFAFESTPTESAQLSGLSDGSLDGTGEAFYPPAFRSRTGSAPAPSTVEATVESSGGWAVLFNHDHFLLSDRRVRKAFAHVFASGDAVEAVGDGDAAATLAEPVALLTGLSPARAREYLGEEIGRFTQYGDRKRAGELLAEVGFFRTWEQFDDPRDGHATLGFLRGADPTTDAGSALGASEPAWHRAAENFATQLESFLLDQSPAIRDSWHDGDGLVEGFSGVSTHADPVAFLPARQWGHFEPSHPYHDFQADLLERETAQLGFGPTVEVQPYDDPGGPTRKVDVRAKLDAVRRATTDEAEARAVRELAWIVNETVPFLQGYYRDSVAYVATDGWDVPAAGADALNVRYPAYHLPRTGALSPDSGGGGGSDNTTNTSAVGPTGLGTATDGGAEE